MDESGKIFFFWHASIEVIDTGYDITVTTETNLQSLMTLNYYSLINI